MRECCISVANRRSLASVSVILLCVGGSKAESKVVSKGESKGESRPARGLTRKPAKGESRMTNPISNHDMKVFSGLSSPDLSRRIAR